MSIDPENYRLPDDIDEEDEEIEDDEEGEESPAGPPKFSWLTLLKIMSNPVEGWKQLRRTKVSPETVAGKVFYPSAMLASLSAFTDFFYDSAASLSTVLVKALLIFVSFFFGYFVALSFLKLMLPSKAREISDTPYLKEMIQLMMTTLAIFFILYMCLPIFQPLLVFLPLWTIYLISKGTRFLKVPEDKAITVTGFICVATVGAPALVAWIFNLIIP